MTPLKNLKNGQTAMTKSRWDALRNIANEWNVVRPASVSVMKALMSVGHVEFCGETDRYYLTDAGRAALVSDWRSHSRSAPTLVTASPGCQECHAEHDAHGCLRIPEIHHQHARRS